MSLYRNKIGPDPVCEVHMMVSKPEQWVKPMATAGASIYTFHYEATENPQQLIKEVRFVQALFYQKLFYYVI